MPTPANASVSYKNQIRNIVGNVAAPTGVAATDTAVLQAALTAGGYVGLQGGTYLVNSTLEIPSNTTLYIPPDATIKQDALVGAGGNLIVNSAYAASTTNITVTWTAGVKASVGWTGHGKSVGDWVSIENATPSMFLGVFRIDSVTDVDNFVVELWRIPTGAASAVSGSIVARQADVNIRITGGGTIDYDFANNDPTAGGALRHAVILGYAHNVAADFKGKNSRKYHLCVGAIDTFDINVNSAVTNSDTAKVYGPARGGIVRVSGKSSDDSLSFQTREPTAFATYRWTYGDVLNISAIVNGNCGNGGSPMSLYGSQNELMDVIDVKIMGGSEPDASAGYAMRIIGDPDVATSAGGDFGLIHIHDSTLTGHNMIVVNDTTIDKLIIDDSVSFRRTGTTANKHCILMNATSNVRYLACNAKINDTLWPGGTAAVVQMNQAGATLGHAVFGMSMETGSAAEFLRALSGTTVSKITLNGCDVADDMGNCIVLNSGALGTPAISVVNSNLWGASVVNASASCSVYMQGNRFFNFFNGVIRTGGTPTISIASGGGNQLAGSSVLLAVPSGTPVISVYGFDLGIDIGATGIAATNGSYCLNTGVGRGTIVQNRLVTCNGTNWFQVDTPANTF